jgi:hypothetical protein
MLDEAHLDESVMASIPWGNVGAGGLVTFAVLLLLTGRIVTRAVYQDMVAQRDKWEAAWRDSQQALAAKDIALDTNTEALKTLEQALNGVMSLRGRP